ncbi:FKBP-type peptidyl-prolyl cis-trans isomerase [Demequina aurantiaca]|uniref:FKBP-type peptidyl-prolyl cis-trans isomerase n=1 Tax=Demequina aurantiaca TaxID=676200 RepID=UPI000781E232|nr:FKBP-type peptidyl-prolyl cis-trans isomerase [Demequina aurantiaca]
MRRLVALTLAASLALVGCSSTSSEDPSATASATGQIEAIAIGSSDSLAPTLDFVPGLAYPKPEYRVEWEGEGEPLQEGQPLLLDIYGESLQDHTQLINTYDGLPRSFLLAPEVVGDDLYEVLKTVNVGARILQVSPAGIDDEGKPPVAIVVDVLPIRAQGTNSVINPDMPAVTLSSTGEPTITIPDDDPPADVTSAVLIQGTGPQITSGSFVTVNYVGVHWDAGKNEEKSWESGDIFETSWPSENAPFETQIGVGQVIAGWDQALIDVEAGSQVEIVVPPESGYPDMGTLVFVVDVLDVWNPGN